MATYYFIQIFEKGLFTDKAECYTDIKKVFSRIEELSVLGEKYSVYSAECLMDLTPLVWWRGTKWNALYKLLCVVQIIND